MADSGNQQLVGWLREWESLVDLKDSAAQTATTARPDELIASLSKLLGEAARRIEGTKKKTRRDAATREADSLAPLVSHLSQLLKRDAAFRHVCASRGADVDQLRHELGKRLDHPRDYRDVATVLENEEWRTPAIPEAVSAASVLAVVDHNGRRDSVQLLANLTLRRRAHAAIARAPRRAICEAAWRAVFDAADDKRDLPGQELATQVLRFLIDDSRLPRRASRPEPDLRGEVQEIAQSSFRDPLGAVSFQLVHGLLPVRSARDVEAGREVVRTYVFQCLLHALHARTLGGWDAPRLPDEIVRGLHKVLDEKGWLPTPPEMEGGLRVPETNIFVAAITAAARLGADLSARTASESMSDSLATAIAEKVWSPGPPIHLGRLELREQLRPLVEPTLGCALGSLSDAGSKALAASDVAQFADYWASELGYRTARGTGIEWLFPRGPTVPEPAILLDEGLRAIVGNRSRHVVSWIVSNITPRSEPWSLGRVTFLDPAAYDTGHGEVARQRAQGAPSVLARVEVEASSREEARLEARPRVESALDVLAFGFSAMQERSGLHPRVDSMTFIESPDQGGWGSTWSRHRADDDDPADGDEAAELARAYQELATRAHADEPRTSLEKRIFAALSWYRRARWEVDGTRRVLGYWIVLEQFFVGGKERVPKRVAAERAARLYRTWRELPDDVAMMRQLHARLVRHVHDRAHLAERVDSLCRFTGWRTDDFVLMEPANAQAFVAAVGSEDVDGELPRLFVEYVESFRARAAKLRHELRLLQWHAQIVLERAYRQRNLMVHEGSELAMGNSYLATELEKTVELCLSRAVGAALHDDPPGSTSELLNWWSQPW